MALEIRRLRQLVQVALVCAVDHLVIDVRPRRTTVQIAVTQRCCSALVVCQRDAIMLQMVGALGPIRPRIANVLMKATYLRSLIDHMVL